MDHTTYNVRMGPKYLKAMIHKMCGTKRFFLYENIAIHRVFCHVYSCHQYLCVFSPLFKVVCSTSVIWFFYHGISIKKTVLFPGPMFCSCVQLLEIETVSKIFNVWRMVKITPISIRISTKYNSFRENINNKRWGFYAFPTKIILFNKGTLVLLLNQCAKINIAMGHINRIDVDSISPMKSFRQ